jgi:regulatory protein SWI6
MTAKQTKLNTVEQSVRSATRMLSERRQQIQRAQSGVTELEQTRQKISSVKKAIQSVGGQDWTGRGELRGENVQPSAFREVVASNKNEAGKSGAVAGIVIPERGQPGSLERLRRMNMWEDRISRVLEDRMKSLEGDSAERAIKYRKLVSLCTKVPVERVDGVSSSVCALCELSC